MKKIFTKNLFLYMLLALAFTVAAIFGIQTVVSQTSNLQSSYEKLQSVKDKLASNEQQIEQLTASLGENNLAKTRAFADLLEMDPSIMESTERMEEIKERLMVNELHVIDENGIITHSTVAAYIGFDMGSGAQSAAFLDIIKDPSLEIVQEPQENATEQIIMQYVGVSRKDAKGCVQVGIRPEILENMLAGTSIDVVLEDIDFGKTGYVYAVDTSTGLITAHPNTSLIGQPAAQNGFPANETGQGKASIDGVTGYYVAENQSGTVIGTFMPEKEYYADRLQQTMVVSLSIFLIFAILLFTINRMVDRKIVHGIHNITNSMKKIAGGDFSIVISEESNPEFSLLSSSINIMVESIRSQILKNEELLKLQKEDMDNNLNMIENVKQACKNLNQASKATLMNAQSIRSGTSEQEQDVANLENVMTALTSKLNASANASTQTSAATKEAAEKILQTRERMEALEQAIQKISDTSTKIGQIIDEINSIAQQTKMLSLNASIEAARAGEMGKGFAVVASQVGELAARSSQAAKETGNLIIESIHAVEDGKTITEQTVTEFAAVVSEIEAASLNVEEITEMVLENASSVSLAMEGLHRIFDVVEKNVAISQDGEKVSTAMSEEVSHLQNLIK